MGKIVKSQVSELLWLMREVEKKMGKRLATPADFDGMLLELKKATGKTLAMSTVKRLWGYVGDSHTPNLSTLDLLSQLVGCGSWSVFCERLAAEHKVESEIFNARQVSSSVLREGDRVLLAWMPDRECRLEYMGGNTYKVVDAVNAKILPGDTFSALAFQCGHPLCATALKRDGSDLGNYTAGTSAGLTFLQVERGADGETVKK